MTPNEDEQYPTHIPPEVLKSYCKLRIWAEDKRVKGPYTPALCAIFSDLANIENKYSKVPNILELIKQEIAHQQELNNIRGINMSELDDKLKRIEQHISLHVGDVKNTLDELKSSMQTMAQTYQTNRQTSKTLSISDNPLTFLVIFTVYFLIVAIVCSIIYRIFSSNIDFKIDLNLGELVGGTLVGLGASFAGAGYAYSKVFPNKNNEVPKG